jgi:hypothetical protein
MSGKPHGGQAGNRNAAFGKGIRRVFEERARSNPEELETLRAQLFMWALCDDPKVAIPALSEYFKRTYGNPAQDLNLTGDMTYRNARELSEAELIAIASSGSAGSADEAGSAPESTDVH